MEDDVAHRQLDYTVTGVRYIEAALALSFKLQPDIEPGVLAPPPRSAAQFRHHHNPGRRWLSLVTTTIIFSPSRTHFYGPTVLVIHA